MNHRTSPISPIAGAALGVLAAIPGSLGAYGILLAMGNPFTWAGLAFTVGLTVLVMGYAGLAFSLFVNWKDAQNERL